ncbi:MAG TPA: hypothetical protein VGJ87_14730, partial [Roseiflexaceae bacterium]
MSQPTVPQRAGIIYTYYAIVPDTAGQRVLLLPGQAGWTLPCWETAERYFWQSVDRVNRVLRDRLGIDVTTLRCLRIADRQEDGYVRVEIVYAMENHNPVWTPPSGGRWTAGDELDGLTLAMPEHHAILRNWFIHAAETSPLAHNPPWYAPGWFAAAIAWIQAQLDHHGLAATAPVEQLRSWER